MPFILSILIIKLMALFITCKKEWLNTVWAKRKIDSLIKEANKKKINYYFFFSLDELKMYENIYLNEKSCILLISNVYRIDEKILEEYKELPLKIISASYNSQMSIDDPYSYSINDIRDSIIQSLNILKEKGCKHPSLVGLLENGNQDYLKIGYYKKYNYSRKQLIFDTKTGYIYESIKKLLNSNELIDAIICSNDFQAMTLIKVLELIDPNWNEKLLLLSYGNTQLASYYKPTITSQDFGFEQTSKKAILIYETLIKNPDIKSINVVLEAKFNLRETTNNTNPKGIRFNKPRIISDKKIRQIITECKKLHKIERLLMSTDEIDLIILYGILNKMKRKEIANRAHCSESTIKYRLNEYKKILNVDTNKEAIELLSYFVDKDKLLK